jgi:VIT1/CCC1 family predicted Fe2+/Mn2+ transporter
MSLEQRWFEEMRSAWLYREVAASAEDSTKRRMFEALEKSALGQAEILACAIRKDGAAVPVFEPDVRARLVAKLARALGPKRTRGLLAALKVRGLSVYNAPPPLTEHVMPLRVEDVGARHKHATRGAGGLRAAVFGVNDGLVSNTSLILGMAGATDDAAVITLTGVAGLLAGAFSMAAGEYVSVRSQRELYEHQIAQEREELTHYPEEEAEELALIYNARGVPLEQARTVASTIFRDPEQALRSLSIEELGINPDDLGSAEVAAASSFIAFALGAAVPLLPAMLSSGAGAGASIAATMAVSGVALFAIGCATSLFSGRSALRGGVRMLAIGCGAGLVTYLIGRVLGVASV